DTRRAYELNLSDGVARAFLDASPIERIPQVPGLLVHGSRDDIVPLEISEAFARASGAELQVFDDDHFGPIDPDNPMWKAVVAWLCRASRRSSATRRTRWRASASASCAPIPS